MALYEVVDSDTKRAVLAEQPDARGVFGLLLGSAFSLWRAAFLSHGAETWPENLDAAKRFLDRLIGDNAIGFPQDRDMRDWTSGYYLHNAKFRLEDACRRMAATSTSAQAAVLKMAQDGLDLYPRQTAWDRLCDALEELLRLFKTAHVG